jgi:mRNA-degrading endonuclease toxin of MazEF toxin-antitoxin module
MVVEQREAARGETVIHSDHGTQFTSWAFTESSHVRAGAIDGPHRRLQRQRADRSVVVTDADRAARHAPLDDARRTRRRAEHEGEVELLPGIRLLPAPGHTDGHQVVVVATDAGTNVLGGDVGVSFSELGSGTTEGQRRVLALEAPTWLSHAPGPKIPEHRP